MQILFAKSMTVFLNLLIAFFVLSTRLKFDLYIILKECTRSLHLRTHVQILQYYYEPEIGVF